MGTTILHRSIGEGEEEAKAAEQERKEIKQKRLNVAVLYPATLLYYAFVYGLAAGVFLFLATVGVRLALG